MTAYEIQQIRQAMNKKPQEDIEIFTSLEDARPVYYPKDKVKAFNGQKHIFEAAEVIETYIFCKGESHFETCYRLAFERNGRKVYLSHSKHIKKLG